MEIRNAGGKGFAFLYSKSPKYYKKIFFIYFFLLAIVFGVVVTSVMMYNSNADDYDAFVDKTTQLEKFKKDTDVIFDTAGVIVDLMSEYDITQEYAEENIESYSTMDFERMYAISRMLSKIQTDFAAYNLNIAMTRYSDNIVITGDGSTETIQTFLSEKAIDVHKAVSGLSEFTADGISYSIVPSKSLTDKITVTYRKNFASGASIYYILFFGNDELGYRYDENADTGFVYSNYMEEYEADIKNAVMQTTDAQAIQYFMPKKNISCFFVGSDVEEHKIVYVKNFADNPDNMLFVLLPWSFMLLVAAFVFAALLAKYSYIPFGKLLMQLGISRDGHMDEFAAVEERINSIIDKNSDMQASIEHKNGIIRSRFLFDVLNGFIWGERFAGSAVDNGLGFLKNECRLYVIEIDGAAFEEKFSVDSMESTGSEIFAALRSVTETYENAVLCAVSENRMALICDKSSDGIAHVLSDIDRLRYKSGERISIAIGDATGADGGLSKVYRLLIRGLDNKSLINKKDIITMADINALSGGGPVYSVETEAELTNYIVSGEKAKAVYCLKNIFESCDVENIDDFRLAMIITIKRILSKLDVSESEICGGSFSIKDELESKPDVDGVFAVIKEAVEMIAEYAAESINSNATKIGDEIITYINENLRNDISIGDISERFGISPSYIGRILRNNYGTTFKTYINEARIKKAKQMMDEDKNILIKDLAASLGYNNAVSFIRMFKKSEGISPGQYLNMK